MPWDEDTLDWVYDRTNGYCRYCGMKLARINYGRPGARGAWEVDHSVPVALGGTDYLRNLWPACIECNRDKGTLTGPHYARLVSGVDGREPASRVGIGEVLALILFLLLLRALMGRGQQNP